MYISLAGSGSVEDREKSTRLHRPFTLDSKEVNVRLKSTRQAVIKLSETNLQVNIVLTVVDDVCHRSLHLKWYDVRGWL